MFKSTRAEPAGTRDPAGPVSAPPGSALAGSAASRKAGSLVIAVAAVLASAAALAMPVIVRVPVVRPHGKADPAEPGVFSHWLHDEYSCTVCHPTIFPKARVGFTHDDMDEGKFCGACHNGQSAPPASGERAACRSTCHAQ